MSESVDIAQLRNWVGRQEHSSDIITPELVKRFKATLEGYTSMAGAQDSALPHGLHWCLAPPAVANGDLGADGHPARGGFLPPVPLPRRMWASSVIRFHRPLPVASTIERTSTIADVTLKQSRTAGPLVFVQIDHRYTHSDMTLIEDRQTIVYRSEQAPAGKAVHKPEHPVSNPVTLRRLTPNSTLLFRYSALTFNGHKIHYDHRYSVVEEGYPGLVVQGPLTATLLMNLAQGEHPQRTLREFAFRAVAPAFVDEEMQLSVQPGARPLTGEDAANTSLLLEARNQRGILLTTANASFA